MNKTGKCNMIARHYRLLTLFGTHNVLTRYNKSYLTIFMVGILMVSDYAFCQNGDTFDAAELVQRYKESVSWSQSLSMELDVTTYSEENSDLIPRSKTHIIFRRDGKRTEWIGQFLGLDSESNIDPSNRHLVYEVMTEDRYVRATGHLDAIRLLATISMDYEERQKMLLDAPDYGGPLWGKMYGNNRNSLFDLLSGGDVLKLHENTESINGILCHIIEATTKYGKVTAWIAPDKGYNALKWQIHKTHDDLFDEEKLSKNAKSWTATFNCRELEEIGDQFVTKNGCFTHIIEYNDGSASKEVDEYLVSNIQLNPDFEALGAFQINLPEDTPVHIEEFPGVRYIWSNGRPVAHVDQEYIDVLDNNIETIREKEAKNDLSKPVITEVNIPYDKQPTVMSMKTDAPRADTIKTQKTFIYIIILIGALIILVFFATVAFYRFRRS